MEKDALKSLYEDLKDFFEKDEEIILEDEKLNEIAFKELIEGYEEKYRKLQKRLMEIKIQKLKQRQKKSLEPYAKQYGITVDINEIDEQEENEIILKLRGTEDILNILKGKSQWGSKLAKDIKEGRWI